MGKILIGVLAIFLLLGAFASPILDGIKGWRTENTTQNAIVVTGAGITTSNVTLLKDLYQDETTEVIAVTSNITETPVATSYDEDTNNLLISALTAAETRTLTINYYGEPDNAIMKAIGPFLAVLIIGGLIFLIIWGMRKNRG
jgi:hypothetical protein